eukprot:CAMPEP_0114237946 /NCGR_PEP_ID=MMETSP0058-20121206/7665_1 /TAXON_ID=36894 /ORGANISM="Pyramimonas parkeae, CCMP726" /LENGTH=319 /DNA_ID=CAMNT_0001350029 /DNA_START=44 /DNA_END=1003 /DNA_ORIENTATION=+
MNSSNMTCPASVRAGFSKSRDSSAFKRTHRIADIHRRLQYGSNSKRVSCRTFAKAGSSTPEWVQRRDAAYNSELQDIEEKLLERSGFFEGLMLRMKRDSSKQSAFEQGLQKAADQKFQGLRKWKFVFEDLRRWGIKSMSPEEALSMVQSGKAVLVDVREPKKFDLAHADRAVNVPLYTSGIQGSTGWDKLRKAAFAGFAMEGTERNPEFLEQARAALSGSKRNATDAEKTGGMLGNLFGSGINIGQKKILVICQTGGTLEKTSERVAKGKPPAPYGEYGNASRSLMAIHELYEGGLKNIAHVDGGFGLWKSQKMPISSK